MTYGIWISYKLMLHTEMTILTDNYTRIHPASAGNAFEYRRGPNGF